MGKRDATGGTIGRGGIVALLVIVGLALLPARALDGESGLRGELGPERGLAAVAGPCGGEPMAEPDEVIEGEFGAELEKGYVLVPFKVPARSAGQAVTGLRVKYCHDQPELAAASQVRHTLDLGLYEPRTSSKRPWGRAEFRGWGGSSHPDVTLSADGFEAADGSTTPAFLPGAVDDGLWAAELGVASVASEAEGDGDGKVAWRIEIDHLTGSRYADEPYELTRCARGGRCDYDDSEAKRSAGWYAGDLHVHGEHSALGDAPLEEVFSYAFCPDPRLGEVCEQEGARPGAGLDFITLSDYVGGAQWGEIGRHQPRYPGKLIIPSAEVITYRGHLNAHGIMAQVDYRTGPLYEWERASSKAVEVRGPRPPSEIFEFVKRRRPEPEFTQINHPTIFPSDVPAFEALCRGCPWDYTAEQTDYSQVDAIEIATGPAGLQDTPGNPGPNPFTLTAIRFWEDAIDADGRNSNRIAAVGVSDSHNAGRREGTQGQVTQAPIGQATTVVRAPELSAEGIRDGVLGRHTYVKVWGNDGPDLRLRASEPEARGPTAIMGDLLHAPAADLRARVFNLDRARRSRPGEYSLTVYRNGAPMRTDPIPAGSDSFELTLRIGDRGRYRLQVDRSESGAASIEAVSSPIWLVEPSRDGCRRGSRRRDHMRGGAGNDCFKGARGPDRLHGRGGDDRLFGDKGRDRLNGGLGDDWLRADRGRDRVRCGAGRDLVVGATRRDDIAADCERVHYRR